MKNNPFESKDNRDIEMCTIKTVDEIPFFDNAAVYGLRKNIHFVPTKDRIDSVLVKDITVK